MKKIFEFIGWALVTVAVILCIVATICVVGGAITFIMTLCNVVYATAFSYFAITFFASIILLFIIYLIVWACCEIEKVAKHK
jgi:hypothetical protein